MWAWLKKYQPPNQGVNYVKVIKPILKQSHNSFSIWYLKGNSKYKVFKAILGLKLTSTQVYTVPALPGVLSTKKIESKSVIPSR